MINFEFMLNPKEIEELVSIRDKEKINLELKSIRIITETSILKDQKQQLAYGIVGLANKNGGKLILGVNDDGSFDGKYPGNTDDIKEYIHNICRDKISPVIEFEIHFVQSTYWDVFIINIPKRRNIPHAYVSKRNGHEIVDRVYYTRTPNGKKLLTDIELEWMFKNQEQSDYSSSFRLLLEFSKQFGSIGFGGDYFYRGSYRVNNFLDRLSKADKKTILEVNGNLSKFLLELIPYLILGPLCEELGQSWYIGMHEEFDRGSSGPLRTNIPIESDTIYIADIPTSGMSIINSFSWDFKELVRGNFLNNSGMKVPVDTKINIVYETNVTKIHFKHPKFSFEILVGVLASGSGLHQRNPNYEVDIARDVSDAQNHAMENYFHFDGAGRTKAVFEFLAYDIDEFKRIEHYYNTLKILIDKEWNFDKVREGLPHLDTRIMHSKVDDILYILQTFNANPK